jgi:transcriptional regulator with XRE-family HTH domain
VKIGEKIRVLRKRLGVSPEKLADKSDVSGAYIRRLEAGHRHSITLDMAQRLAKGLGVSVSALVDHDDLPEKAIKDIDLANFFRVELPCLDDENKDLLRYSINIIRERIKEKDKYKAVK